MSFEPEDAVGRPMEEIETPALVVDLDIMEANMDKMMDFLKKSGAGVGIRPHAKTHKTPEIARMQMDRGAVGICCAKLGEAEAMADGGLKDILIANQVVGANKVRRLVELSKRTDLKVAVDSTQNVLDISGESAARGGFVGIIIETEVGMNRAGTRTHAEAVEIAKLAGTLPGVWFAGIMGYEGHAVFMGDYEERKAEANRAYTKLLGFRDAIRGAGIECRIVSTGGTGTYLFGGCRQGMTDIEAGSYIFMDTRYGGTSGIDFMNSLAVLATIVSHPQEDLFVCDAGIKSMTEEFGVVSTLPSYGLKVLGMSEEHVKLGPVDAPDALPGFKRLDEKYACKMGTPKVGDKVLLIPSHCCSTTNLHDFIYAVRAGKVEAVWKVAGRGKFA